VKGKCRIESAECKCSSPDWPSYFLILALTLALTLVSTASPIDIEVAPRSITVGDPVEVLLSVDAGDVEQVIWPAGEVWSPAEILKVDTLSASGSLRSMRYSLSLFEPGRIDLPDLPVVFLREGNQPDTLWLDPGSIEVRSIIAATGDSTLRDIRPPVKLPLTLRELAPYLLAGGGLAALAIMGYLLYRKRVRKERPIFAPPLPPPDQIALRKLEELRVRRLWQDGYVKEYHSELTDIMREYLGRRFDFNALDMTSEEILALQPQWAADDDQGLMLRRILTGADLAKFARFKPAPRENERALDDAFKFVSLTGSSSALTDSRDASAPMASQVDKAS